MQPTMQWKGQLPAQDFYNAVEVQEYVKNNFLCGYPIQRYSQRRLVALSQIVKGDTWLARLASRYSKRTIERLVADYQRRGIYCLFHNRRLRVPEQYESARNYVISRILAGRKRVAATVWSRELRQAGICAPSIRSIRRWCRETHSLRRKLRQFEHEKALQAVRQATPACVKIAWRAPVPPGRTAANP
jgi:hypothetical protein